MAEEHDLKFSHFADLLRAIATIPPQTRPCKAGATPKSIIVVRRWIDALIKPLHETTGIIFFRLLFPEEDSRRRYNLGESSLSRHLASIFFMDALSRDTLFSWATSAEQDASLSKGCLGYQIQAFLEPRFDRRSDVPISLSRVNELLDELASRSPYSTLNNIATSKRKTNIILEDLYRSLSPWESACLTQIILRDLRPLLYSPPSANTSAALLRFNTSTYHRLSLYEVMKEWHPDMPSIYRQIASTDAAAEVIHSTMRSSTSKDSANVAGKYVIGTPISVPKCLKGTSCTGALRLLSDAAVVWAETKYDGERMQIHIDTNLPFEQQIKIFSKSKRDSTKDRVTTLPIIRSALKQPSYEYISGQYLGEKNAGMSKSSIHTTIIEAEMVPYSEETQKIDEFWRIRSLIESTAQSGRANMRRTTTLPEVREDGSECSISSNASDHGSRHLMLVFFDILHLNGHDLTNETYESRRRLLEQLIHPIQGFSLLAERYLIKSSDTTEAEAIQTLQQCFSSSIADHQEGLVLKSSDGTYNNRKRPWVKLKKDYIPRHGDSLDLVCLAAGWNKERARELLVGPETYTDFFVGVLLNHHEMNVNPLNKPRFGGIFTVSYGLSREQLEDLNYVIKLRLEPKDFKDLDSSGLPYTFELNPMSRKPTVFFRTTVLLEVFGAGFTKSPGAKHYELRFPRISKVWRSEERDWRQGTTAEELHRIALEVIGRDSEGKRASDRANIHWGQPSSPGQTSMTKRKANQIDWEKKMRAVDEQVRAASTHCPESPVRYRTTFLVFPQRREIRIPAPIVTNALEQTAIPIPQDMFILKSTSSPGPLDSTTAIPDPSKNSPQARTISLLVPEPQSFHLYGLNEGVVTSADLGSSASDTGKENLMSKATVAAIISDGFVYIHGGCKPRALSVKTIVSPEQRLFTLDALLEIAGWRGPRMCSSFLPLPKSQMLRAVVFLEDEHIDEFKEVMSHRVEKPGCCARLPLLVCCLEHLYASVSDPTLSFSPVCVFE